MTPREFVCWFRDAHSVDGNPVQGIITPLGWFDLDSLSDSEAELIAKSIMLCCQPKGNA
jgi:hypothetical protein